MTMVKMAIAKMAMTKLPEQKFRGTKK